MLAAVSMSIGEHFGVEREGLDKVHWTVFTTMEKLGLFRHFGLRARCLAFAIAASVLYRKAWAQKNLGLTYSITVSDEVRSETFGRI